MVMTYDITNKRTQKFKKLLGRYLVHTQFSVFTGDITEAKAVMLRREISLLMHAGDRVVEITAANRHNIDVHHIMKHPSGKGEVKRVEDTQHKTDYGVL
jgi:CRISPR-associated protein Cas2